MDRRRPALRSSDSMTLNPQDRRCVFLVTPLRMETAMAWYRIYFVDPQHDLRWPYDLYAQDDAHALALAHAAGDACSDVQISVELWQGARRIAGTSSRRPETIRAHWEELPIDEQQSLLQIEEALLHSGTKIARSRRLLERLNSLRD